MKRFEKKLDEYYVNKYIEFLKCYIFIYWNLDFKIEKKDILIEIFVKNRKYKDTHYKELLAFRKDRALYFICNFKAHKKEIIKAISHYSKENQ